MEQYDYKQEIMKLLESFNNGDLILKQVYTILYRRYLRKQRSK